MDRSKGKGLQQNSRKSGSERPIQRVQEHTAIGAFFDSCVDHRKDQAAGNQQSQWQRGYKGFEDVRNLRMQKKVPAEKRGRCEEPCDYREEADCRVKRSPSSPCGWSLQLKLRNAGQEQREAD